jgi:outer membrane protein OmpA-like peptidoglycan-associated protein
MSIKTWTRMSAWLCLLLSVGVSLGVCAEAPVESPFMSAYQGTALKKSGMVYYDALRVPVENGQLETRLGQISAHYYQGDNSITPREVRENLLAELSKHQGRVRFECDQHSCPSRFVTNLFEKTWLQSRVIETDIFNMTSKEDFRYLSAEFGDEKAPLSVQWLVKAGYGGKIEISQILLEPKALPAGKVTLNPDAVRQVSTQEKPDVLEGEDAKGTQDHPLISRYQGSVIKAQKTQEFAQFRLVKGFDARQKVQYDTLEGRVTTTAYEVSMKQSTLQIFQNYLGALQQAGLSLLYQCELKDCGDTLLKQTWAGSPEINRYSPLDVYNMRSTSDFRMANAVLHSDKGDVFVQVAIDRNSARQYVSVDVVETSSMPTGRVVMDVKYLMSEIERTGRVVLHGLNFDFNQTTLTADSTPALKTIHDYLAANPAQSFYVVGHTDNVGDYAFNLGLSDRRAKAIVDKLKESGIAASRLAAVGVGPVAPLSSNRLETGQASNRRVELVLK